MDKQAALVRDEFNLNKILIVTTSVGKVNLSSSSIHSSIFPFEDIRYSHTKWWSTLETLFE